MAIIQPLANRAATCRHSFVDTVTTVTPDGEEMSQLYFCDHPDRRPQCPHAPAAVCRLICFDTRSGELFGCQMFQPTSGPEQMTNHELIG